eukprot:PhF_6_TR11314/c0_g1_i2/m.18265
MSKEDLRLMKAVGYAVTGAYAAVAIYRSGILHPMLPYSLTSKLDELFPPPKTTKPEKQEAYQNATSKVIVPCLHGALQGFALSALGSIAFYVEPRVPIALPIALTILPIGLLFATPSEDITPVGQKALFCLSTFMCGYSFGPINATFPVLVAFPFFSSVIGVIGGGVVASLASRTKISLAINQLVLSSALGVALLSDMQLRLPSPIHVQVWAIVQVVMSLALAAANYMLITKEENIPSSLNENQAIKASLMVYGATGVLFWFTARLVIGTLVKTQSRGGYQNRDVKKMKIELQDMLATIFSGIGYVVVVSHFQGKFGKNLVHRAGRAGHVYTYALGMILQ